MIWLQTLKKTLKPVSPKVSLDKGGVNRRFSRKLKIIERWLQRLTMTR